MITVHHLNQSRSQRVLFALEELGVPYEIVRHERDPKTMLAPKELLAVHPLGKSPVLVDDGITIAESGAILEYLVEKYGAEKLPAPTDAAARNRYRYFMHYAEGSLMPVLLLKLITDKVRKAPFLVRPIASKIADQIANALVTHALPRHFALIESNLEKNDWLTGDQFNAADIQMSYPLEAAMSRANVDSYPRTKALLERLRARPAYQRAVEKGGPVTLD